MSRASCQVISNMHKTLEAHLPDMRQTDRGRPQLGLVRLAGRQSAFFNGLFQHPQNIRRHTNI